METDNHHLVTRVMTKQTNLIDELTWVMCCIQIENLRQEPSQVILYYTIMQTFKRNVIVI